MARCIPKPFNLRQSEPQGGEIFIGRWIDLELQRSDIGDLEYHDHMNCHGLQSVDKDKYS